MYNRFNIVTYFRILTSNHLYLTIDQQPQTTDHKHG